MRVNQPAKGAEVAISSERPGQSGSDSIAGARPTTECVSNTEKEGHNPEILGFTPSTNHVANRKKLAGNVL
jgi:hypothetical protein